MPQEDTYAMGLAFNAPEYIDMRKNMIVQREREQQLLGLNKRKREGIKGVIRRKIATLFESFKEKPENDGINFKTNDMEQALSWMGQIEMNSIKEDMRSLRALFPQCLVNFEVTVFDDGTIGYGTWTTPMDSNTYDEMPMTKETRFKRPRH